MLPSKALIAAALVASTCGYLQAPASRTMGFDLLVTGAKVVDGSGSEAFRADVGIRAGTIAAIGDLRAAGATKVIAADGLVLAPGFIDVHTHADEAAATQPGAENFVLMGVTTIVTGNCGSSVRELGQHLDRVERKGISLNYASLVGHGTVRRQVMDTARREATPEELAKMKHLVEEAMRAGAFGLSTGLIYVPGTYAPTEEIVELCRVVAGHGGVYATHMRNEGDRVLDSIEEAVRIGREAGVPVQVSHLKASGKGNWGRGREILERLALANAQGVSVTADQYAYPASSTSLDILFPSAALEVGKAKFAEKLQADAGFRSEMQTALLATMDRVGFGDFSYARIATFAPDRSLEGLSIKETAQKRLGKDDRESQAAVAIDLMVEAGERRVSMVYFTMSEEDVEAILRAPFVAIASDAGIRTAEPGKPHPRGSGNNPRVLGRYVREKKVLTLAQAVRKMTSLPAKALGIADRGFVRIGFAADLVLFDPETVADGATFEEPVLPPVGIPHVIVNGVPVVEGRKLTGARAGKVLRKGGRGGASTRATESRPAILQDGGRG